MNLSLALLACHLVVAPAPASSPLTIDDCAMDEDELAQLVRIESGNSHTGARVHVWCETNVAHVQVTPAGSPRTVHTALDLSQAPHKARTRIVALGIADLLQWSRAREHVPSQSVAPRLTKTSSAPPPLASAPAWWLWISPQWRTFASSGVRLWGGSASVAHEGARWAQALQLSGERGVVDRALGSVTINGASATPMASLHRRWKPAVLRAGLGLRLSYVQMHGTPATDAGKPADVTAFVASPLAFIAGAVAPAPRVAVELRLCGGYVLAPLVGSLADREQVTLGGAWVGLSLSLGFAVKGGV